MGPMETLGGDGVKLLLQGQLTRFLRQTTEDLTLNMSCFNGRAGIE